MSTVNLQCWAQGKHTDAVSEAESEYFKVMYQANNLLIKIGSILLPWYMYLYDDNIENYV